MPELSTCPSCASALAGDQRYCLGCGVRVAPRPLEPAAPAEMVSLAPPALPGRAPRPRPRTAAALILVTLGVGTLAGAAAGPGAGAAATPAPIFALTRSPAPAPATTPSATPAPPSASGLPDDRATAAAPPAAASTAPAPAAGPASPPSAAAAADPAPSTPAPAPAPSSGSTGGQNPAPAATPAPEGPPAKHVVVVSFTGHDRSAFAPESPAKFLAHDLPAQGALLRGYRATTTGSLANGLSLLAGAKPTDAARKDCPDPADEACRLKDGAKSLPTALADGARSWKAYVQAMPSPCATQGAPGYAPARNPFAFMGLPDCASSEATLDPLADDFSTTDSAPAFAYVVPDSCHDGREADDCAGLEPTGLERADAWAREWIPKITGSKAFADGGLLVVLFDGGNLTAADPPATEPRAVGAVVVSSFARKAVVSDKGYDHLSLLRTIAGSFGVKPPGAAGQHGVKAFGRDVLRSQDVPKSDTSP